MTQRIDRIKTTGSVLGGPGMSRRRLIGRLAAAGFSAPVIASILRESTFAQEATPEATRTTRESLPRWSPSERSAPNS